MHPSARGLALASGLALSGLVGAAPAAADYYDGITAYENQDYAAAHRELQPLAEQGDSRAQRLLGLMYRDGDGVPKDDVRAYMWLELAARRNQYGAADLRDELAERMLPWQVEEAKKLADAWRQGQGSDPADDPAITAEELPEVSTYTGSMSAQQIADLQWQLALHGYDPGAADGRVGPRTTSAIRDYQADAGLPVDGQPSAALLDHLQYTDPPVRNSRVAGTPAPSVAATADEDLESAPAAPALIGVAPGLMTIYTQAAQEELARRGYYDGPIDGVAGPATRAAIARYQEDYGLPPDGEISLELVNHLRLVTMAEQ
jgi:peptidoglycan hydrolase-like protein with peptidoglycan-binding domain